MSNLKTTTVTVAVVVALAAIPFSQQHAEANRIQTKLQTITSQPSASQQSAARKMRTRFDRNQKIKGRSAGSLLASLDGPVDNRAFIRNMMVTAGTPDPLAQAAVASRIQQMSLDERKNLIRALKNYPMDKATKNGLATKILDLAPEISPREKMEELILWGRSMSHEYMNGWAASDPDAAMQWFWEKRATGELDRGLGPLGRNLYESTLNDLLRGVASKSPAKALDLYGRLPQEETNPRSLGKLAGVIARLEIQRGDPRHSKEMLDTHSGSQRKAILEGVLGAHASEGLFDEGMAIVDGYIQSPSEREEYLKSIFKTGLPFWKLGSGLDWLVTSTPENEAPAVMRAIIQTATFNSRQKTLEWVESKGPGAVRDHAYAGWIEQLLDSTFADDFPRVLPAADMIEDPVLRTEIRQLIETKWNEQDKEKASEYIPTDVLKKLENLSARNPTIR